jgi:transcriptional regulator with XRE-family HTH domain
MTSEEFRIALRRLGISQRRLALDLGVAISTTNKWATGKAPVAPYVSYLLRLIRDHRDMSKKLSEAARINATLRERLATLLAETEEPK